MGTASEEIDTETGRRTSAVEGASYQVRTFHTGMRAQHTGGTEVRVAVEIWLPDDKGNLALAATIFPTANESELLGAQLRRMGQSARAKNSEEPR